jgi:hypothetical protein
MKSEIHRIPGNPTCAGEQFISGFQLFDFRCFVCRVQVTLTCRSHPSSWFQLAKMRLAISSSALSDGAKYLKNGCRYWRFD